MNTYLITYTTDFGATSNTMTVQTTTFTEAYLAAYTKLPKEAAITAVLLQIK